MTDSLHRGKTLPANEYPGYDTKQSNGEVPVMLEFWGMQSTPLLPLLPGPLCPGVVVPDSVLSLGQKELKCVLMLNWIVRNRTVYIYKNGLDINNLLGWCVIKPNQTKQVLPTQVRVDLRVMAMKGYSIFPQDPGLELHH